MCETSLEESDMFDNQVCDFLDATMGVVADFASMLANGIYLFWSVTFTTVLILLLPLLM